MCTVALSHCPKHFVVAITMAGHILYQIQLRYMKHFASLHDNQTGGHTDKVVQLPSVKTWSCLVRNPRLIDRQKATKYL